MRRNTNAWTIAGSLLLLASAAAARADEVKAAVAANFTEVIQRLAPMFKERTGHDLVVSFGSSGKLASQIENGAPFEVLLSADSERPRELEARGAASGRFTYATGKLVLWSPQPGYATDGEAALRQGRFNRLAIANPKNAPYGVAAEQTLRGLGLLDAVKPKLVTGDSIAQTFQFAVTGNVELAFVALSQVKALKAGEEGSAWVVPQSLYEPIDQDAVLLAKGAQSAAAKAFLAFLQGDEAKALIRSLGYEVK